MPARPRSWIPGSPWQKWQHEHLTAWIFHVFGNLALALAALGLSSVVSCTVARRTNEFGIRMALVHSAARYRGSFLS